MTDVLPDNKADIPPDDPTDAGEPPAELSIELPVGSETVIFGGCHLDGAPTESSEIIVAQLATAIDNLRAPGAVILAGDVLHSTGATITTRPRPLPHIPGSSPLCNVSLSGNPPTR